MTGTPAGIGAVLAGQEIRGGIEGFPDLVNRIVEAAA
jgi:2-keto-4-pentenoate hydratase/2-oxohepta-3-ene-1,7-dioic acid hydratase in catechol pathway